MDGLVNTATVDLTISTTTTASGIEMLHIDGTYGYSMLLPILPDNMRSFNLAANTDIPL